MTQALAHSAEQGGLMLKSIGDQYPYSVVGVGFEGWQCQNLLESTTIGPVTNYKTASKIATKAKRSRDQAQAEEARLAITNNPEFAIQENRLHRGWKDSL